MEIRAAGAQRPPVIPVCLALWCVYGGKRLLGVISSRCDQVPSLKPRASDFPLAGLLGHVRHVQLHQPLAEDVHCPARGWLPRGKAVFSSSRGLWKAVCRGLWNARLARLHLEKLQQCFQLLQFIYKVSFTGT